MWLMPIWSYYEWQELRRPWFALTDLGHLPSLLQDDHHICIWRKIYVTRLTREGIIASKSGFRLHGCSFVFASHWKRKRHTRGWVFAPVTSGHIGLSKQRKDRVQFPGECFTPSTWPPFLCFPPPKRPRWPSAHNLLSSVTQLQRTLGRNPHLLKAPNKTVFPTNV